MLDFKPISSSSEGNAYTLSDGSTKILIECGLRIKDLKKALHYQVRDIDACLLSHEHMDHAAAAKDIARMGIDVYTSAGTIEALGASGRHFKPLVSKKTEQVGAFKVLPFDTVHDAAEPLGFLIQSRQGERLLFATDTEYIPYRFRGLNKIAVECNYSEDALIENIKNEVTPIALKNRLRTSHFSFENYIDFLKVNDTSQVTEIWLIHMSSRNADPEHFRREAQRVTGAPAYIA